MEIEFFATQIRCLFKLADKIAGINMLFSTLDGKKKFVWLHTSIYNFEANILQNLMTEKHF